MRRLIVLMALVVGLAGCATSYKGVTVGYYDDGVCNFAYTIPKNEDHLFRKFPKDCIWETKDGNTLNYTVDHGSEPGTIKITGTMTWKRLERYDRVDIQNGSMIFYNLRHAENRSTLEVVESFSIPFAKRSGGKPNIMYFSREVKPEITPDAFVPSARYSARVR